MSTYSEYRRYVWHRLLKPTDNSVAVKLQRTSKCVDLKCKVRVCRVGKIGFSLIKGIKHSQKCIENSMVFV